MRVPKSNQDNQSNKSPYHGTSNYYHSSSELFVVVLSNDNHNQLSVSNYP